MSDKKLKLSHRIAGVIDRLIKTTKVKEVDLSVFKRNVSVPVIIESAVKRADLHLKYNPKFIEPTITPELIEIIDTLKNTSVISILLEDLNVKIRREEFELFSSNDIFDLRTRFSAETVDFFKKYNISSKLNYKTKITKIDFDILKPKIYKLKSFKFPVIKENLYVIKKNIIVKKSVSLSYLSEKQQLNYWRKAVIATKKEPKELELIGVYYNVPYYDIEKLKVDYKLKELSYKLKENIIAKKTRMCNIIVFRDIMEKKGVIIEE